MRILLDTHTYIWALLEDKRLSHTARRILRSDEHDLFFSLASLWELSINLRLGRLRTLTSSVAYVHDTLAANHISLLPVAYPDILALEHLDLIHRDPFDRILVAQAMANNMKLLTRDTRITQYPVPTIW